MRWNTQKESGRTKINAFEVLVLIFVVGALSFLKFAPVAESSQLDSQIEKEKKLITEMGNKIDENPMTKRLNAFGKRLRAASEIMQLKDYSAAWNIILSDLKKTLPKNATIKANSFVRDTGAVSFSITLPDRQRLVDTMAIMEDFDAFSHVDFDSIVTEKITLSKGDKVQYTGYSTALKAQLDPEYLKAKYDQAVNEREERNKESSNDSQPEDQSNQENTEKSSTGATMTGSLSQQEWTGSVTSQKNDTSTKKH